jgi:hypothetical protein
VMRQWHLVAPLVMVLAAAGLSACGAPKEPLMAQCRALMGHGDPISPPLQQFAGCMESKDYHLTDVCGDSKALDVTTPLARAVDDPKCWEWGSTDWP